MISTDTKLKKHNAILLSNYPSFKNKFKKIKETEEKKFVIKNLEIYSLISFHMNTAVLIIFLMLYITSPVFTYLIIGDL